MNTTLIVYCAIIVLCSALGGSLPSFFKLTHRRIQLMLSFVSGVMLGVAMFHLLPHSIYVLKNLELALAVCLGGLLFMFFLIRTFHFHQHDLAVDSGNLHQHTDQCEQSHDCDRGQDHGSGLQADKMHIHCDHHGSLDISWMGLCFGLAIHTIIDGVALAAAVSSGGSNTWAGLGVFFAILLHKPLDALSITSLMAARGWDMNRQLTVNLVFALMCPLGAILFALGLNQLGINAMVEAREIILGLALAFSAGIFLCISLGDLLPEVHFHSHDRIQLSAMLLFGVGVAVAMEFLAGHNHKIDFNVDSLSTVNEVQANQ